MFDWASFLTGIVGAVLGAGASLMLQISNARQARLARRREIALEGAGAFRGIVRPLMSHSKQGPNVDDLIPALQGVSTSITALRLELKKAELPVAEWVDAARSELAHVTSEWGKADQSEKNPKAMTNVVNDVAKHIAEWATGREGPEWFSSNPVQQGEALVATSETSSSGSVEA